MLGASGTTDTVTLLTSGAVSVSGIASVLGGSGTTDTVTLLTSGAVSVSAIATVIGAPAPPTPSPC